jgi:ketosteroid isomerase-like protein
MADIRMIVASIYEAIGRGDVPAVLGVLAEDIRWEEWEDNRAQRADVPWLKFRSGRDGAVEFFQLLGGFQVHELRILSIMTGEFQAAVEAVVDLTPPNGERYRDEEIHLWTFNEAGKVTRLRHYVDTAKHIAAARRMSVSVE